MSYRAAWGGLPALCQPQALLPLDPEQIFFNFFFPEEWRVRKSKPNTSEDPSAHSWGAMNQSLPTTAEWMAGLYSCAGPRASVLTGGRAVIWLSLDCRDAAKHVAQDSPRGQTEAPHREQRHWYLRVCYTRLTVICFGLFCCLVQRWGQSCHLAHHRKEN